MKPRLLDTYCCAGGASMGYHLAGFEVVGVDVDPQPNYPFEFHQGDAVEFIKAHGHEFDAIAGSPPCQRWTVGAGMHGTRHLHPDLIAPTRAAMLDAGRPYVIENVRGARSELRTPITLCGQMFDLGVRRHRDFEVPWWSDLLPPHTLHEGRIGDGRHVTVAGHPGGYSVRDDIQHGDKAAWERAMGIDWMTADELAEAIPPAYTEFIGRALMAHIGAEVAA